MSTSIVLKVGVILTAETGQWEVVRADGRLAWVRLPGRTFYSWLSGSPPTITLWDKHSISYNPIIGWNMFYKQITK